MRRTLRGRYRADRHLFPRPDAPLPGARVFNRGSACYLQARHPITEEDSHAYRFHQPAASTTIEQKVIDFSSFSYGSMGYMPPLLPPEAAFCTGMVWDCAGQMTGDASPSGTHRLDAAGGNRPPPDRRRFTSTHRCERRESVFTNAARPRKPDDELIQVQPFRVGLIHQPA